MATVVDKKLSQLASATSPLTGDERVAGLQDADNVLITPQQIAEYAFNFLKDTDTYLSANSDSKFPTQQAVKTYIDNVLAATDTMVFKGAIDCSTNPDYPAADAGWTYKVSATGRIGGASGVSVNAGFTLFCTVDGSLAGDEATVGTNWTILQINSSGSVIGPSSSVANHVVLFDGSSGTLLKDSGLTLSGHNTGDETTASIGLLLANASLKSTLADADKFGVADTASGSIVRAVTWQALKSNIRSYTDTLYPAGFGTSTGTNTGDQTNILGNAGTATRLQTARTVDGVSFDGTANINVVAPAIHAASYKAIVDADEFGITDSAASYVLRKVTYADFKNAVRAYLDPIYTPTQGASPTLTLGLSNAQGVATTFLRTDASIAVFTTSAPSTLGYGSAAAVGVSAYAARSDHVHAMPAAPTGGMPALVFSTTNAPGASPNFLRRDDQLAIFDGTVPAALAFGGVSASGVVPFAARRDHTHALPSTINGVVIGDVTPAAGTFTSITADVINGTIAGNADTATSATTAVNLTGGVTGSLPYQSSAGATAFLSPNTSASKQFLSATGTGTVGAAPSWVSLTKADVGLSNVENVQLSTWSGTTNQTIVGTITTGVWTGTTIGDSYIASNLTGKTYNGLSLTAQGSGFSVSGGSAVKTLTVPNTLTLTAVDGSTLNVGSGGTLGTAAFSDITAFAAVNQNVYIGTTLIALNRSAGGLALTGITSIDGSSARTSNIIGGLVGSIPYQSATNTTSMVSPNSTLTRQFLSMTGTGSAGTTPIWVAITKGDFGLSLVENTALSTWAGSSNLTTVGTITTGVWNGTAISDSLIASALTGKTYNSLSLSALVVGFSLAGGATSRTLTVSNTLTLSGTDGSTINVGAGGTLGTAAFTDITRYVQVTDKGVANGVASLDASGLVPSSQLPSFVDSVQEYSSVSTFPTTGSSGVLYVAQDTNKVYRWSGSSYIDVSSGVDSVAGKTGTVTLIAADVGLSLVENTALSTWAGSANITTLGTITSGIWSGSVIADNRIASDLTGKTYNGLTLAAGTVGFSLSGGSTSKTLTVSNTLTLSGTDASALNIGTGGTLGSAAFTDASSYMASNQTLYIGTTQIALNRASGALSLTGITSIDGSAASANTANTANIATNMAGGTVGSVMYQSATDVTVELAPNTSTTKMLLSMTGTGSAGAAPVWSVISKSDLGLSLVENTALSTWAGSSNLITVGAVTTGVWNGTVIGDSYIASALTGKTYNGLALTSAGVGFTVAGGSTSKTLTVSNTLALAGTDGSTLNVGTGGTLGTAAFVAASSFVSASQTYYVGTTQLVFNRASGALALTGITSIDGNAASANTLQTARLINGVSFNGSADITVAAAAGTLTGTTLASGVVTSSLTSVGTLGNLTVSGNTIAGGTLQIGTGTVYKTQPYVGNAVLYWETANTLDQVLFQKGISGPITSTDAGRTWHFSIVTNYDGVTASSLNPNTVAATNHAMNLNVGVSSAARGSAVNIQKVLQINNTDTSLGANEYANTVQLVDPMLGMLNGGNTLWQNDWTINGAKDGADYNLFGTVQMIAKWNSGGPTSGLHSAGMVITTRPKSGAGSQNRTGLTTYPIDIGLAISGFSGVNNTSTLNGAYGAGATKGFEIGIVVGGKEGPWLNDGSYPNGGSMFGTGMYVTDHVDVGIRIAGKHPTGTSNTLALVTHSDAGLVSFGTTTPDTTSLVSVNGSLSIIGQAWNGNRLKLGSYQMWFDASNNLRYKTTNPTGDTDGTVVGGGVSTGSSGDFSIGGVLTVYGSTTTGASGLTVNHGMLTVPNAGIAAGGNIYVDGSYQMFAHNGTLKVGTDALYALSLGTNGATNMTISTAGHVLVNSAVDNGTDQFQVTGSSYLAGTLGVAGSIYVAGNYSVYSSTGTLQLGTMGNFALYFGTNNQQNMTVSSAGRVLIGTTSDNASASLQVNGSVAILNQGWNASRLKLGSYQVWFDASSNLRYKTTNPTGDTDGTIIGPSAGASGVTSISAGSSSGGLSLSASASTGAVTITLSGTPSQASNATTLNSYSSTAYCRALAPSTGAVIYATNSGNSYMSLLSTVSGVTTSGDGSYAITIQSTSDRRLKRFIDDEQLGIEFINQLRPRTYYWIDDDSMQLDHTTRYHGFIYDEVASVYNPEGIRDAIAVNREDTGEWNGVDYMSLISPLVKSTQQLYQVQQVIKTEQETLKERIRVLEEEVVSLRSQLM